MMKENVKTKKTVTCYMFHASSRGGFSFIESMLSVFLVSVGLVVAVKLLTAGLANTYDSRNQFTASLLAQEGVEIARNVRDNNWVDNNPTTNSFSGFPVASDDDCVLDKNDVSNINTCSGSMQLNLNGNYYVKSTGGGNPTKFFRRMKYVLSGDVMQVTSLVSWNSVVPSADEGNCNTASKCTYTQITLGKWAE
jgi:hypothetical protein